MIRNTRTTAVAAIVCSVGTVASMSAASVVQSASGVSAIGTTVAFKSVVAISGNTLTITLTNESAGSSLGPADVLGSYYFDIVKPGNIRPTLTYVSAVGDVYTGVRNGPDPLVTAGANLKAVNANDETWQFKTFNPASIPFTGFGLGTVGNSALANSFNGNIVGGIDYCIAKGEITTSNLNGRSLVKGAITFTFTGVNGFTESDIADGFAFGLGTAPDSIINGRVPSPGVVSAFAAAGLVATRRRRSAR